MANAEENPLEASAIVSFSSEIDSLLERGGLRDTSADIPRTERIADQRVLLTIASLDVTTLDTTLVYDEHGMSAVSEFPSALKQIYI